MLQRSGRWVAEVLAFGTIWPLLCVAHLVCHRVEQQLQPTACLPVMQTPGGSKQSIDYSHHPPLLKVGTNPWAACFDGCLLRGVDSARCRELHS